MLIVGLLLGSSFGPPQYAAGDNGTGTSHRVREIVSQVLTETNTPGAVVGVYRNEMVLAELAVGNGSLDPSQTITIDHCFRIGSIAKVFLGVVVLQLAEENQLSLEDRLSKYLPDYPGASEITLRQLGTMTARIKDPLFSPEFKNLVQLQPERAWTTDELISETAKLPRWAKESNSTWHYSNSAAVMLGHVVEQVTGNSLPTELRRRIFDRLNMQRTGYELTAALPTPYSRGYTFAPPAKLFGRNGKTIREVTNINPSQWNAAGAMHSTVGELRKFVTAVGRSKLLTPESHAIQTTWHNTPWPNHRYGFLLAEIHGLIGHDGDVPGYSSFMGYRPDDQLTIIVLTNMHGWSIDKMPANEIAAGVAELF